MPNITGHILVVDDSLTSRHLLSRQLVTAGHSVREVASGQEALDYLQHHTVDVIMLDAEMPDMTGLEILTAIRANETAARVPVLMVTAKAQSDDMVTALEMGADDYVTKPINIPVVMARLNTQLQRKRAEDYVRESEERYALAAAGANDGLWDWKISANQVHFSQRWKAMLGHDDGEIGNSPDEWFTRIHPQDHARVRREIELHLAGLSPLFESEHRIQHKSGGFRWVLTRGMSIRNHDGMPTRMAGSQSDITDGKVVDALTGLPNRMLLLDRLERIMQSARTRPGSRFAVLFFDLDGFKLVNDSLGHIVGDELIQAVARRLEGLLRAGDTVSRPEDADADFVETGEHTLARLGGDEFIVLLHEVRSVSDATRVGERLMHALSRPFNVGGRDVFTGASIGIAVSTNAYTDPEELIRDADTAMYRAKALGKGRCEVFDSAMREEVVARLRTETAVRLGVERHEFLPFFQPIVDCASGRLVGFEALIRWRHPERGIVAAPEFVSIIEENGLLEQIGERFLHDICAQLRRWHVEFPHASSLWVNVNFSSRQLLDPDLASRVVRSVEDVGLRPEHIVVEITEATAINNFKLTSDVLGQLRGHGLRVVLDDFGTGYSSLACLDRLPITGIKLDPSFTAREAERPEILRAVVALAHSLGLTVTAEGVEAADQFERLRRVGCKYAQGFLFARPLDANGITEALASNRRWLPEGIDVRS